MENTIAGSTNDKINMNNTLTGSMNVNINMDYAIAWSIMNDSININRTIA